MKGKDLQTDTGTSCAQFQAKRRKLQSLWSAPWTAACGNSAGFEKTEAFPGGRQVLLSREDMFPGYMFIETDKPVQLGSALERSREYPKLIGNDKALIVPVEKKDLEFLESCRAGKTCRKKCPSQSGS